MHPKHETAAQSFLSKLLEPDLLHFSTRRRVHMDCWRDGHLQLTARLFSGSASLAARRFVATVHRPWKTFSSSPQSRDIPRFISLSYWLNPRRARSACGQVVLLQQRCCTEKFAWEASAISQDGAKGDFHWDCFGFCLGPDSDFKKKDIIAQKCWEGGEELHFSLPTQCVTLTPCRCALL